MAKILDITGHKYNRLTVIRRCLTKRSRGTYWVCKCECGNEVTVSSSDLRKPYKSATKSCGCLRKEVKKTHGKSNTKLYQVYSNVKGRCNNPNNKDYKYYGGKGVRLSEDWERHFTNFYRDMEESYKSGLELDRIDNDGNYSKENCRWITHKANIHNTPSNLKSTSKYKGVSALRDKWLARIKQTRIGVFASEDEAALAYNKAASKTFGKNAYLNRVKGN